MKRLIYFIICMLVATVNANAKKQSDWVTIRNGNLWIDNNGKSVQAHSSSFVKKGDTWYLIGEDRSNPWNPDVNLYKSTDLQHWTFVSKIIENGVTDARLGKSRMIERAKLFYNAKTKKWVVWCHWESKNYGASEAACFVSDKVEGQYKLVWAGRPLGIKSRDCNIFTDNDGKAYFISTTTENTNLGLFELSNDYLSPVTHTLLFEGDRREAPVIVRLKDTYYMLSSACTGWSPNQCMYSYSKNLKSGWAPLTKVGNNTAYRTQATAVLEIKGTKQTTYLYVGDRWMDPDLPNSKTIIFPLKFEDNKVDMQYRDSFEINLKTGEWREIKPQKPNYTLIWHQEFDTDGRLNDSIWNYEHGFVRNHEDQWYQSNNAFCHDGKLVIMARKVSRPNPNFHLNSNHWATARDSIRYTSASVTTARKFSFLYGSVEVRAKIPTAGGAWPAIWLLGSGIEWPSCGEIDMMEYYRVNGIPHILANACWGNDKHYDAIWNSKRIPFTYFTDKDTHWADKYHIWRMDWDKESIKLYLDDELLNDIPLSTTINGSIGNYKSPFNKPMYLLLNLAIGGDNGGTIDDNALPMSYLIDYVRVYQKK